MSNVGPRRRCYPSDLTEEQWRDVAPWLESTVSRVTPARLREILNAVNYRWTTGCSWRMLPHDFPPWSTVCRYVLRWQRAGLLGKLQQRLLCGPQNRRLRCNPVRDDRLPRFDPTHSPAAKLTDRNPAA